MQPGSRVSSADAHISVIIDIKRIDRIAVCRIQGMSVTLSGGSLDRAIGEFKSSTLRIYRSRNGQPFYRRVGTDPDIAARAIHREAIASKSQPPLVHITAVIMPDPGHAAGGIAIKRPALFPLSIEVHPAVVIVGNRRPHPKVIGAGDGRVPPDPDISGYRRAHVIAVYIPVAVIQRIRRQLLAGDGAVGKLGSADAAVLYIDRRGRAIGIDNLQGVIGVLYSLDPGAAPAAAGVDNQGIPAGSNGGTPFGAQVYCIAQPVDALHHLVGSNLGAAHRPIGDLRPGHAVIGEIQGHVPALPAAAQPFAGIYGGYIAAPAAAGGGNDQRIPLRRDGHVIAGG